MPPAARSSLSRLLGLLNQSLLLCNPFASQQLVLLALQSVVVDEEGLQLAQKLLWQIRQFANHRIDVIRIRDSHQTVIAGSLLPIDLLSFNDADEPRGDQHTG